MSGRTLVIASFHLKCTIMLKCSSPFRAGIVSPLCRQLQFGLILSLVILVKIALFSTGQIQFSKPASLQCQLMVNVFTVMAFYRKCNDCSVRRGHNSQFLRDPVAQDDMTFACLDFEAACMCVCVCVFIQQWRWVRREAHVPPCIWIFLATTSEDA